PISGPGALTFTGAGTSILTAANTYSGGTTIIAGALQVGDGGANGSLVGDVVNNGSLTFNRSDSVTFSGLVSGTGGLRQIGTGVLTLSGLNTYLGATSITAGTLAVASDSNLGAASAGLTLNGGTLLTTAAGTTSRAVILGADGGTIGDVGGIVTIADGAHLAPGASVGTLSATSLLLSASSQLDYELGLPGVIGAGVNDRLILSGDLRLDGQLNITDTGGFSRGVYQLIRYGGALTDNGLEFGTLPSRFSTSSTMLISTSTPGEVNLIVNSGGFGLQFWDGAGTASN